MTITDKLLELDPTLEKYNEGNWMEPYTKALDTFASFNDAGLECETGEFLYSLVRLLKPHNVLETGTHVGVGASYMGMGLKDNGKGHLDTYEFLYPLAGQAQERINKMGLNDYVTIGIQDVRTIKTDKEYQLILLDTEPQTRFAELEKFFPNLAKGGFVFIHDLHRHMGQVNQNPDHPNEPFWPYGPVPEYFKELVRGYKLRPFHFTTPRGLTGFYKTADEDYQWI